MKSISPIFIAVTGGSGSGKSYFSRFLINGLGKEDCTYLCHDRYYKEGLNPETTNYDHPDSIDEEFFRIHLNKLKIGESVEAPVYDYVSHSRISYEQIAPNKFIIIDGILVLNTKENQSYFDISIYVNASSSLRLVRRLERDVIERGRTPESVIRQFNTQVEPMHKEFVEKQQSLCQFVVNEKDNIEEKVRFICSIIKE